MENHLPDISSPAVKTQQAIALLDQAVAKFDNNQVDQAVADTERAISLNPKIRNSHYLLAQCYIKLNRFTEATHAVQQEISLFPDNQQAVELLAGLQQTQKANSMSLNLYQMNELFFLRDAESPASKASQLQLFLQYQSYVKQKIELPAFKDVGYRVYSQFDEDGKLLFLFSAIGIKNRMFIDIGAGDGVHGSNVANLAVNFKWRGLMVEADQDKINFATEFYKSNPNTRYRAPKLHCAKVTCENINEIIQQERFGDEIDLLSIDLDGNDYWIWKSLHCIQPRVVIIETQAAYGYENRVTPYDPEWVHPSPLHQYYGSSSIPAMVNLAHELNYKFVGTSCFNHNCFFIQDTDENSIIPEVTVESVLEPATTNPYEYRYDDFNRALDHLPFMEG